MSVPSDLPSLQHHVRPGLRLIFIGYNPGLESARQGHYYAFGGNVFWRQLSQCGLVPREVSHLDDGALLDESGIGFTDLCCRPTAKASDLTKAELAQGAKRLFEELTANQPRFAVVSGKGIYQLFAKKALAVSASELKSRAYGIQPERIGRTIPYVIPSSSGLASKWHRERLELLQELATILRLPEHGPPATSPSSLHRPSTPRQRASTLSKVR
jgi:TDG/mug DNA glycosylase family protein